MMHLFLFYAAKLYKNDPVSKYFETSLTSPKGLMTNTLYSNVEQHIPIKIVRIDINELKKKLLTNTHPLFASLEIKTLRPRKQCYPISQKTL